MQAQPNAAASDQSTWVGKPLDRVDGRAKVTGAARYAADFQVPNVAHACLVPSTIAHGVVTHIDADEARRQPGVLKVITHEDKPHLFDVSMDHQTGKPGQTFLPLQGPDIKYAGQYVAIVVAETLAQAQHAAGLVRVAYAKVTEPKTELKQVMDQAFAPKKIGRGDKPDSVRGKPDDALAAAPVKVDQVYTTPNESHNPMEMSATIAAWDGDRLTLYDATQWVYGARSVISTWLGVNDDRVRVIDPYVGGGFGVKGSIWPHEGLAAVATKMVGRPVKLMLTRQNMFSGIGHRPETHQRVALGAEKDGKLTAIIHESTSQTSVWKDEWTEPAAKQTRMLYACPNVRTSHRLAPYSMNSPTQMRAPGHATGTFALEVAMDELAYALNLDPLELRRVNYAKEDEDEKKPFSSKALTACYDEAAQRFGWSKRNPQPRSMRDGHVLIGYGMATATYPTNRAESKAKVKLLPDGRLLVTTASHDLGTGTYTILTQIAAESFGLRPEQVKVEIADTVLPEAPVSGGSQTAASVGSAVKLACQKGTTLLFERAAADPQSPLHKKPAAQMALAGGRVFLKDSPSTGEPITDLLKRNGGRAIEADSDAKPELNAGPSSAEGEAAGKPKPPSPSEFSKHAWGAQFCEVHVDEQLRQLRVARFTGAFAAGRILNAKTAHSQVLGGIVWGISAALHEEIVLDPRRGKIVNDNLADYLVPVNPDVPAIDCFFVKEEDPNVNPLGVKGVGELGITGAAAAIVNAVYHATGMRIRDLPVRMDKLLN